MGSSKVDFDHRRGLAWSAYGKMEKIWKAKHIPLKLKIRIFDASVISIILYGCESWIVTKQIENKINVFANDCYRGILGIKRTDRVTIEEILRQVKRRPLSDEVRRRQLGWLVHTPRLTEDEPAKIFALYEPKHGLRRRGAQTTYKQQIAEMLSDTPEFVTVEQINELAHNKKTAFGRS